jgi:hypothetical protein
MEAEESPSAHRHFEEMAVAHVLGGLDTDQGRVFRAHLLECSDCRARVGELRAIAHDLAGVERDERRERSAQAVETKSRQEPEQDPGTTATSRQPSRLLVLVLVGLLVGLSSYTFILRGNLNRAEHALEDRLEASAALEHGEELPLRYRAPGVEATVKVNGDRIVVLLEGVTPAEEHAIYLMVDTEEGARTVYRHRVTERDGRVFVLLPLRGTEDRLIVTEGDVGFDPDGERVLAVLVPTVDPIEQIEQKDAIGSA